MARTLLLALPAALLVASAWLRLVDGSADSRAVALVVLALLPALARPLWARVLAAAAVLPVAASVALGVSPLDARPFSGRDFFRPAWERFREGSLGYWEVAQPFVAAERPAMHDVLLVALFAFSLAITLALAARRPLLAGVTLLAGSMWPATLVAGSDLARGAVTLGVVLLFLAAAGDRPARNLRPALVAGVALVAAAVAASTSPAVAKQEFLSWKTWDLYDEPAEPVSVRYAWNGEYGGIQFPKQQTAVLHIEAPRDARYWRATSLDAFVNDRWVEDVAYVGTIERRGVPLGEPLLPRAARNRQTWMRADVRVEALDEQRLVGGSMPVLVDAGDAERVDYYTGNVLVAGSTLERSSEYSVSSYVPQPTPARLARERLRGVDAAALEAYLSLVPGAPVPPFGAPRRRSAVARVVDEFGLRAYEPLHRVAREVVGDVRNPYAAVVALEAWFRVGGDFSYEERPGLRLDRPPLVDFVTRSREGYCQHFAGAMALMLRYLGIPARVGAGFTRGDYDRDSGIWTVHDTDAHTWVEAWFPSYGWLPFDPTPSRDSLPGAYTSSSPDFNGREAAAALTLGAGIFRGRDGKTGPSFAERFGERLARGDGGVTGRDAPGDTAPGFASFATQRRGESLLQLIVVVAALAGAALFAAKLALRRSRYLTRDPRRLAGACRRELVEFVADQGIVVPRSATLAEAGALVSSRIGVDAGPFVRAATLARFSPPSESAAASRQARRELRRLLRAVRRRVGVPRRVRGALSLRSLAV